MVCFKTPIYSSPRLIGIANEIPLIRKQRADPAIMSQSLKQSSPRRRAESEEIRKRYSLGDSLSFTSTNMAAYNNFFQLDYINTLDKKFFLLFSLLLLIPLLLANIHIQILLSISPRQRHTHTYFFHSSQQAVACALTCWQMESFHPLAVNSSKRSLTKCGAVH